MTAVRPGRVTPVALAILFAYVPLYGTLAALDPNRPPIPPLLAGPAAAALGVVAVAAYAALVPAGWRVARREPILGFAFLGGGVATLLSALAGFDPLFGIGLGALVLGIGFAALALVGADRATAALALRALLWSATLAGLVALAMVVLRRPAAIYAYDNGRAVGTFLNPNELAAYAVVALGAALPCAIASRGRDRLAVAATAVLIATLGATFSRWGLAAAVCGLVAFTATVRSRALLLAALAVAIAGAGFELAAGAHHHNPRDTEARLVAWRTGWATVERFPLLGVGPLAYGKTYDVLRPPEAPGPRTPVAFDPHSLPLAFAADGGIAAVVVLAASAGILQRRVYRDAARAAYADRLLALGLAAGLVALYVDCAINTISLFFPLGYQSVALALAVSRSAEVTRARA